MTKSTDADAEAFPRSWPQKIALGAPIALVAGAAVAAGLAAINHGAHKGGVLAGAVGAYFGLMIAAALAIVVFAIVCRRDSNRALPFMAFLVVLWTATGFLAGHLIA